MEQDDPLQLDIDTAFAELGLAPGATEPEVKAAWRRLVSQWHPDRNGSAAALARMQRINRAVEAIRQAGFRRPEAPATARAAPADPGDAGGNAPGANTPGADASGRALHRKVRLTLEEAAFGCTRVLQGRYSSLCADCDGVGHRVLGGHCPQCGGAGAVRTRAWFGWPGVSAECDACHGSGIARQTCATCAGAGKADGQRYRVSVRLPHGVRDGDLLGVPARPGTPPGGLNIRIQLQPHGLLTLDDDGTVRCAMPVDGFAWIAHRSVEVPTLDGPQPLALHRDRLVYRLKGQGFPVERRGPRADQLVTLSPVFPQHMTTDQQILLDQLIATTSGPDAAPWNEPLHRWQQAMRDWRRGGTQRG